MNWLDIILIFAVAIGAFIGFKNGLVWQAIRLLSWIASFWLAGRFYHPLAENVRRLVWGNFPSWAAYLTILITVLIASYLIAHMGKSVVDAVHLKLVDRITGSLLGALKIAIVALVIIVYIHLYAGPDTFFKNSISNSYLASAVTGIVENLRG